MRNPYQEDQGFSCRRPVPLAPILPTTAAGHSGGFVCSQYFISAVPSTYIGDEHSPIHHLDRHPLGDRHLHTGKNITMHFFYKQYNNVRNTFVTIFVRFIHLRGRKKKIVVTKNLFLFFSQS
jgi:hypothetical protein